MKISKRFYQESHLEGTKQKWQIIKSQLDENDKTLLDVGCNEGYLVFWAIEMGISALGIDAKKAYINKDANEALKQFTLTPENIDEIGQYDVILLLSVQHQWQKFGKEKSLEMLQKLGNKAGKFIFQPPSIKSKYKYPPQIIDNDDKSIITYNTTMLKSLFPDRVAEYLGKSELTTKKEPYRHIFIVR